MKLIYIAGKYTGKTYSEIDNNIKKAEAKAVELIAKKGLSGYYPVTPHLNTRHFEIYETCLSDIGYNYWITGTAEMLMRCDGILMLENWENSSGGRMEHQIARENNIPIFYSVDEVV